jgi:hypothetical protein
MGNLRHPVVGVSLVAFDPRSRRCWGRSRNDSTWPTRKEADEGAWRAPVRVRSQVSDQEIEFAEPLVGPVLLGAGRYRGYGLCRPVPVRPPVAESKEESHE